MIVVSAPRENVNDDVVIVRNIIATDGEQVRSGQAVIEIETSKTIIEMEAPEPGIVHLHVKEGDEVPIGEALYHIATEESEIDAEQPGVEQSSVDTDASQPPTRRVSNAAIDAARRHGIDIDSVPGSWVSSRAVLDDAGHVAGPQTPSVSRSSELAREDTITEAARDLPAYNLQRQDLRKRVEIANLSALGNGMRQSAIGVTIQNLERRMREPIPLFSDGILDLVVYEASKLLQRFPVLNGFYAGNHSSAIYDQVHAGVSFDSDRNLKVLRIEKTDQLSLGKIQNAINALLIKYESGETLGDELMPSTFTVTDLGHTAADFVLPLLNGYQSLIIGVVKRSRSSFRLVASFDHRVVEGLYVTRFLELLAQNVGSHFADNRATGEEINCHFCQRTMAEERSMGNRGFINITVETGESVVACRNCFDGW